METFQWLQPEPLWPGTGPAQLALFRPVLLRYDSDDFVEEFIADAARPDAAPLRARVLADDAKLFQPAHGSFHVVAASLCCRLPGFPDRQLRRADAESVGFVIRRIASDGSEQGWVREGPAKGWQPLGANPARLLTLAGDGGDEERLPLLPATAADGRALWFGYLPTASADTFKTAPPPQEKPGSPPLDPRIEDDLARFVTPLEKGALAAIVDVTVRLTVSIYLLLELAEFLRQHLPALLAALPGSSGTTLPGPRQAEQEALLRWLQAEQIGVNGPKQSLARALRNIADNAAAMNVEGGMAGSAFGNAYSLFGWAPSYDTFRQRVSAALDPAAVPPIELPRLQPGGAERYALRCVYERPLCDCCPATVSERSQRFRFASFFDADAPARPVRIPLPTDISPAALRRFKKGVTFMLSEPLQRKVKRLMGQEAELVKGTANLPAETADLAFMCSFSIQIIFIVAFFLLMLFVVILNLIFWWMPFFKICLPIPKALMKGPPS